MKQVGEHLKHATVYRPRERLKILREHLYDEYEVIDLDTGKTYMVSKSYFHMKYEAVDE